VDSEAMQEEKGAHVTSHQHTYQQQCPRAPFWESCVLSLFEMTTFVTIQEDYFGSLFKITSFCHL
jgi:hypothetical protein